MEIRKTYKPIACSFHDLLLHHATLKDKVNLSFYRGEKLVHEELIIVDVSTVNSEEFLEADSGEQIRLDHIFSINDQKLSFYC